MPELSDRMSARQSDLEGAANARGRTLKELADELESHIKPLQVLAASMRAHQ